MCGAYFGSGAKDIASSRGQGQDFVDSVSEILFMRRPFWSTSVLYFSFKISLNGSPPQSLKQFCHQFA